MGSIPKPGDALSRRRFLQSSALATAALGLGPIARGDTTAQGDQRPAHTAGPLCLWYDQPATKWMTEALPIGNGPMGAMLFGGTDIERIQFNEISLWSGERIAHDRYKGDDKQDKYNIGAHQAFGDIFIRLGHDPAKVADYRRE